MTSYRTRDGYILLLTILIIGAIALSSGMSLFLLGWAAEQSSVTVTQTTETVQIANACIEFALQSLHQNPSYAGGDTITINTKPPSWCTIFAMQGNGNQDRTFCVAGHQGTLKRRLQVSISRIFPTPKLSSYQQILEDQSGCTL